MKTAYIVGITVGTIVMVGTIVVVANKNTTSWSIVTSVIKIFTGAGTGTQVSSQEQ